MFYQRWLEVVRERGRETALVDCAAGRRWTFAELAARADRAAAPAEPVVFPQGHSAEFIVTLLSAWRWQKPAWPLEAGEPPALVPAPPPPCVHLKSTSASTGHPRLVAFTAVQLAADAANIVATMGLRPDWPNLAVISMAHSYGFSNLVLPLLLHGIPLIIAPSPLPEILRRAAQDFPAITLPGVPALWRTWHEARAIPPNVRLAISAGAPLPLALEQSVFTDATLKIHNFYGSTECGGIAYDSSAAPRSDDACVGVPMQNVKLSIRPDGCLTVHSRAVGQTYWPEPDPMLSEGSFFTSDLAEIKDGLVYLRGRLSDQINVAGRKVSPAAIEQCLLQHPAVRECLVFGVPSPDPDRAEIIVACVATKHSAAADGLKQFLLTRLPAWQVPREWWFVDSLSANQRGKLSRAEWRKKYLLRNP